MKTIWSTVIHHVFLHYLTISYHHDLTMINRGIQPAQDGGPKRVLKKRLHLSPSSPGFVSSVRTSMWIFRWSKAIDAIDQKPKKSRFMDGDWLIWFKLISRVLKSDYNRVPSRRSPPRGRCRCTFSLQVGLGIEPVGLIGPWANWMAWAMSQSCNSRRTSQRLWKLLKRS